MKPLAKRIVEELREFENPVKPRFPAEWLKRRNVGHVTLRQLEEAGLVLDCEPESPFLGPPLGLFVNAKQIKELKDKIARHTVLIQRWKERIKELETRLDFDRRYERPL